jgi:hypothetical protein
VLDQPLGRLADVLDLLADGPNLARPGLDGLLDVFGRAGLDQLVALLDRHLGRRGFGDMNRAADGKRAAGRNRGQFRQGHSYRHGLLSQLRDSPPAPMVGTAPPVWSKRSRKRLRSNGVNHECGVPKRDS